MPSTSEFDAVFQELRTILAEYEARLVVAHDRPDYYYLDTHTLGANKRPIAFGGVRMGKSYVSYYLMCAYAADAKTTAGISPELEKRRQGKACFNFKTVDPALFAELAKLTRKGYAGWKKLGWVD
jgi:hypothetical protein